MSTAYDVIGLIGSFIISAGLVPQVYKVYRTKSATDISYSFLSMYNTGLLLLMVYGYGEALWPIYIPCTIEMVGAISLLVMKVMYSKNGDKDVEEGKSIDDVPVTPSSARFRPVLTPK